MMSTAGSMRPPMSNVSATAAPASGIVRSVWADPAETRSFAVHPEPDGGGVATGNGVTPGSPLTIRTHPGSMIPGFAAKWDFADLRALLRPRTVEWRDPTDWMGNGVRVEGEFKYLSSDPNVNR